MAETVLKIENLSKIYRLGEIGTGTISHDLNRWWASIRGKEDPTSLVGQVNDRTKSATSDFVYALQDINFEVKQGEVLGIIGKNGAGKSTLLKLISKITSPTTGSIKAKGRIASLLEVGTGMHPEMTARENIYLNGAILGMKKWEIKQKFDEIVDFAGIALYIDTPIKRFSSGMSVRLGFAVAAFLEPEILIVDEVLAVGDFEFQKKAIGKMKEVSSEGGRTVLFVSHNMESIKNLCTTGIVLENGGMVFSGTANESVDFYTHNEKQKLNIINNLSWDMLNAPGNKIIKILSLSIIPIEGDVLSISSGVIIEYTFSNTKENINLGTTIEILSLKDELLIHQGMMVSSKSDSKKGIYKASYNIDPYILNAGRYKINLIFGENRRYALFNVKELAGFEILLGYEDEINRKLPSLLHLDLKQKAEFINTLS